MSLLQRLEWLEQRVRELERFVAGEENVGFDVDEEEEVEDEEAEETSDSVWVIACQNTSPGNGKPWAQYLVTNGGWSTAADYAKAYATQVEAEGAIRSLKRRRIKPPAGYGLPKPLQLFDEEDDEDDDDGSAPFEYWVVSTMPVKGDVGPTLFYGGIAKKDGAGARWIKSHRVAKRFTDKDTAQDVASRLREDGDFPNGYARPGPSLMIEEDED